MIDEPPTPDRRVALVVLAAGYGTRLRSSWPKPLHLVAGLPMIDHVLRAGTGANPGSISVVVSQATMQIADYLRQRRDVQIVHQDPPRGTGDAVRCAIPAVRDAELIVMLFSDHPLLTPTVVSRLLDGAKTARALVTVLTCTLADAGSYGRIVRDEQGRPVRLVERKADDPAKRRGPTEINSGMMVLQTAWAREALRRVTPNLQTGEYFLTDLIELAANEAGSQDDLWPVATVEAEPEIAVGVNDRVQLAMADGIVRSRIRRRLMESGVSLVGPETIFIDEDVEIGPDTTILPFSTIQPGTTIGRGCVIGPSTYITASRIGDRVSVRSSTVVESEIGSDSDVGPYAHLRGGCLIDSGVHIGSHAELKNTELATGVKVGHFSYLGDARIGEETNIGAGVVTANYDGQAKHRTDIGSHVFIGSDSILVAPVTVADRAMTGAGAVVTHDVPVGGRVAGVPARPMRPKPGKGQHWRIERMIEPDTEERT